jgi:hypothetical protein
MIQVDTGNHFRAVIALSKYNPQMLMIVSVTLHRISRARTVIDITLAVINCTVSHNILHLCLCDVPAGHPAFGVLRVFDIRNPPVKTAVAVGIRSGIFAGTVICY